MIVWIKSLVLVVEVFGVHRYQFDLLSICNQRSRFGASGLLRGARERKPTVAMQNI